ncbi:MAG: hypothetical protein F6K16_25265 [Symploca sp. SIO2B6]|nr:hypothetical protein [Symploca sp. SIO2B6]
MNNPQEKTTPPPLETSQYSCIFTVPGRVSRDFIYPLKKIQNKGKLILSLLTTVLGITGITRTASAENSPFVVDSSLFMAHGSSFMAINNEQSTINNEQSTLELSQIPDEVRILTPQTGVSKNSATNLVVEYNSQAQIQVSVNQKPLDPATTTSQEIDEARNLITQVWYNIPLEVGENIITVQAGNGTPVSVELTVEKVSSKQIEIYPSGNPRIPADGRSTITLEGDITDDNGQLITEEAVVTLTTSAGEFVGADYDEEQAGFQVLANAGKFTVRLQSGLEAKKVRIRAAVEEIGQLDAEDEEEFFPTPYALDSDTSSLEDYTQVEFITNLRPSIVSGVVNLRLGQSGTDFWGSRQDFLDPGEIDDGTELELGTAIFATGKIGEWLFTGAYNSERPLNETCDGTVALFRGPQECEKQYSVYGDSSTVDYLTPSTDNVYLRFERTSPTPGAEADYAMWGDYRTREFARASQLFSATSRALHGFKGNFSLGNLQLTALYSNDIEGFQRDTIAPNGTSGYYFLSRRLIVDGSETVYLETEDSNRPGTVLERKRLRRGVDYQIEYDRGSLLFTEPILATEFNFFDTDRDDLDIQAGTANYLPTDGALLVRRIVVTYQFEDPDGNDTNIFGGRAQYNFSQELDSESWIGATYLQADEGIQDFELYGADFLIRLGENSTLIGEYAGSSLDSVFRGDISGSAYRFEVDSLITSGLNARAYYRSVDEDFFNNSTASFTPGQTRYGASAIARLGSSTNFRIGYDFEENFGIASAVRSDPFDLFNPGLEAEPGSRVDNSLSTIRAGIQQKIGDAVLGVDFVNRDREDRIDGTLEGDAAQLVSTFGLPITKSLLFRAQNELNLGNDDDQLYPNRTTLGLDWGVYRGVRLQLSHQFFDGGLFNDDSITRLDTIVSHKLGNNTDLTGRYSVIGAFNGMTGQGAVGLNHRWAISPGLRVNLGYEHTFSNSSIVTAAGERFEQPFTPGQTAASLSLLGGDVYTVGVEYSDNPDFKASARFQHREGSGNDNTLITASAAGKISSALTALVRYEQANFANQSIDGLEDTINLRVGLAYRNPVSDRWNALLRYEYRQNPYSIPESSRDSDTDQHLFAAEAIFAPSWRWEFYGKGALRYSETEASNVDNSSTVFLSQLRASYRLGYRMDLAVEGRWIGQSDPDFNETGVAVEFGYYLTPDLRLALGYSFGSVDDDDFNGYRDEGGVYFGVSFKVNELFDGFGRQRIAPPQQQESVVKPIAGSVLPTDTTVALGRGGEGEMGRWGDGEIGRWGDGETILMKFLPPALCPLSPTLCPLPSVFLEMVESAIPDAQQFSNSTNFSIVEK